jgi:hypothetical protein
MALLGGFKLALVHLFQLCELQSNQHRRLFAGDLLATQLDELFALSFEHLHKMIEYS